MSWRRSMLRRRDGVHMHSLGPLPWRTSQTRDYVVARQARWSWFPGKMRGEVRTESFHFVRQTDLSLFPPPPLR